jgi:hypothetical protein
VSGRPIRPAAVAAPPTFRGIIHLAGRRAARRGIRPVSMVFLSPQAKDLGSRERVAT